MIKRFPRKLKKRLRKEGTYGIHYFCKSFLSHLKDPLIFLKEIEYQIKQK